MERHVLPRLALTIVAALLLTSPARAQERTGIPAVVAKARPAVVNIATRQVTYDALLRAVPAQGVGSGKPTSWFVALRGQRFLYRSKRWLPRAKRPLISTKPMKPSRL